MRALLREKFDVKVEFSAHQQRGDVAVDPAQADQTAGVAVAAIEESQVSPGRVVGEVARRLVAKRAAAFFVQLARQIGDLLILRVIVDREIERSMEAKSRADGLS